MVKKRPTEVCSQGMTNIHKVLLDTQTKTNYPFESASMTGG